MRSREISQLIIVVFLLVQLLFPLYSLQAASEEKININTATAEQLIKLKGVGPKLAAAIVEYREKNGPFESVDALTKVKGIGKRIVEQNKAMLCTGNDC